MSTNFMPSDPTQATDPTDSNAGVSTGWEGAWASPVKPTSEAWYDAGPGLTVRKIAYAWRREDASTVTYTDVNWGWAAGVSSDDKATLNESTGNLRNAGPSSGVFTATIARRYAFLQCFYNATPAGGAGFRYGIGWYDLAVYGNHGLTLTTGEPGEPAGVTASDVLSNIIERWCPGLNTDGIQETDYVIQHLAFKDRTYPYDAFLELNKYHLWHLGVWEDRTVTFRPYDFSDYMWEIRTDDPGVTFSPQGPSTDSLFNGIVVTYTDLVSGMTNVVTPDDYDELADSSPENVWNEHNEDNWDEIALSTPTLLASALQVGRAALADRNRPRTPGSITVRGYVRDRAGEFQPGWKVRAGDTISITNFPNDSPRLVSETSWDDESKVLTITVDSPSPLLDAYIDRLANASTARGLA